MVNAASTEASLSSQPQQQQPPVHKRDADETNLNGTDQSQSKSSQSQPPQHQEDHSNKRSKREWLAFRGSRHTRVGNDFQVAALPALGATASVDEKEITKVEDTEKEEAKSPTLKE